MTDGPTEQVHDTPTPETGAKTASGEGPRRLFGEIAVDKGFATSEGIHEALSVQENLRRMDMSEKIGQILLRRKSMTKEQVLSVLREQGAKPIQEIIEGYEIREKIGQGGMGAIFRAVQISTDRDVALKILPPRFNSDETYLKRFLREARVAAQLNHPNIVRCIDAGECNGHYYIAMEFVRGRDLDALIREREAFDEQEALGIVEQVAEALQHAARKNLIHRDIKPSNIMISTEDGLAKLLDLGLAKAIGPGTASESNAITQTGVAVGTPAYISPEQAQGERNLDIRSDFYSLGATLFHMLTGSAPYAAPSAAGVLVKHISDPVPRADRVDPSISKATARLIEIMMGKSPGERFQDPDALLQALRKTKAGEITPFPGPSDPYARPRENKEDSFFSRVSGSMSRTLGHTSGHVKREVKGWLGNPLFVAAGGAGALLLGLAIVLALVHGREAGTAPGEDLSRSHALEGSAGNVDSSSPSEPSSHKTGQTEKTEAGKTVTHPDWKKRLSRAVARSRELREELRGLTSTLMSMKKRNETIPNDLLLWVQKRRKEMERELGDLEAILDTLPETEGSRSED